MSNLQLNNEDAQMGCSGSESSVSGSQPLESAFPDEDEETITMLDVIEREDKLEEEASAVLGNSDEKNCTYPKGYVSRQALYSCATCCEKSGQQAAICLACSLECHDNHEVYELYTKRNYRCDCGNSKFKSGFECKLMDKQLRKVSQNENNSYNHNFSGLYCVCNKRYPPDETDDSAESNDEMWQCIFCEDWYHSKHLGVKELPNKFEELICGQCTDKLEFVRFYKGIEKDDDASQSSVPSSATSQPETTETKTTCEDSTDTAEKKDVAKLDSVADDKSETTTAQVSTSTSPADKAKQENSNSDTNDSLVENKDPVGECPAQQPNEVVECILEKLKSANQKLNNIDNTTEVAPKAGPLFWESCDWRSKLCKCHKCLEMYKEKKCEFLLDEKDTVQYYETQGKANAKTRQTPLERGMSALNGMNRVAVAEALHGYEEMRADLSVYLRKFADKKQVVREEDIHEFFNQFRSKKKPRLDFS